MDIILEKLYSVIIYLHFIALTAIILKVIIIFRNKGFDIPAVVMSFFRIYSHNDVLMSSNPARKKYMRINNFINYYLYLWLFITLIIIVVFQQPY